MRRFFTTETQRHREVNKEIDHRLSPFAPVLSSLILSSLCLCVSVVNFFFRRFAFEKSTGMPVT